MLDLDQKLLSFMKAVRTKGGVVKSWVIDSGVTCHMRNDDKLLTEI